MKIHIIGCSGSGKTYFAKKRTRFGGLLRECSTGLNRIYFARLLQEEAFVHVCWDEAGRI